MHALSSTYDSLTLYSAGSDTVSTLRYHVQIWIWSHLTEWQTGSSVQFFFLAMAMFPDAQTKAQAEIDAVVGTDRLPDFSDYDSLPYVLGMMNEIMRWKLVLPLGQSKILLSECFYNYCFQ